MIYSHFSPRFPPLPDKVLRSQYCSAPITSSTSFTLSSKSMSNGSGTSTNPFVRSMMLVPPAYIPSCPVLSRLPGSRQRVRQSVRAASPNSGGEVPSLFEFPHVEVACHFRRGRSVCLCTIVSLGPLLAHGGCDCNVLVDSAISNLQKGLVDWAMQF